MQDQLEIKATSLNNWTGLQAGLATAFIQLSVSNSGIQYFHYHQSSNDNMNVIYKSTIKKNTHTTNLQVLTLVISIKRLYHKTKMLKESG